MTTQNPTFQTSHFSGLWFVNLVISGAIGSAVGCLFESILLGVGLSFCFFLLFYELTHAGIVYSSRKSDDLTKETTNPQEKPTPAKRRISWIRVNNEYYVPPQRTPGRISYAEFSLATQGKGPMGFFES